MNTVKGEWDDYETTIVPEDAPEIQRQETRRGFYAGYLAAFMQITYIAHNVAQGNMSDAAGRGIVEGLREELTRFAEAVRDGRA